jgi:hypothetical protein
MSGLNPPCQTVVGLRSMRWHGTTPFDAAAERLTVAFDVVPI